MTFLVEIGTDMGKCINTQTDVFFGKRYIKSMLYMTPELNVKITTGRFCFGTDYTSRTKGPIC
jgi:hypothetical protein